MSLDLETIRVRLSRADVPSIIADAFALIAEVERLRAEVAYLRASVPPTQPADYGHEAWTEAVRAAVAEERAAVVAWLRSLTLKWSPTIIAYAVERGEHRCEGEP